MTDDSIEVPQVMDRAEMQVPGVEFLEQIEISSNNFPSILDHLGNPDLPYSILNIDHGV